MRADTENNGHNGKERQILDLIPKEGSWEQIIYQVVAMENLDPWDIDLTALAVGFADYVKSLRELDFRIPAKWVIIAAVLLRMKSDYLKILKMDGHGADEALADLEDAGELAEIEAVTETIQVNPIDAIPKRKPVRRVTLNELVNSLRNVLASEKRRDDRIVERRGKVKINDEDIGKRIESLYSRITGILGRIKDEEVKFSRVVEHWNRAEVVDAFLPLIHLDNDKKVECRQPEMFEEIFIKKRGAAAVPLKRGTINKMNADNKSS